MSDISMWIKSILWKTRKIETRENDVAGTFGFRLIGESFSNRDNPFAMVLDLIRGKCAGDRTEWISDKRINHSDSRPGWAGTADWFIRMSTDDCTKSSSSMPHRRIIRYAHKNRMEFEPKSLFSFFQSANRRDLKMRFDKTNKQNNNNSKKSQTKEQTTAFRMRFSCCFARWKSVKSDNILTLLTFSHQFIIGPRVVKCVESACRGAIS